MKFSCTAALLLLMAREGLAQTTCTGTNLNYNNAVLSGSKGTCLNFSKGKEYKYPDNFGTVRSETKIYQCPTSGKRVMISNGIPDHDVYQGNPNAPCEVKWAVSIPLNPTVSSSKTELPARGAIAMATNGVPAYGPMEASDTNAVEPDANSDIQDAQYWYGHAAMNNDWHVHNPHLGKEDPSSDTLLAYAFDGFPIYGPLSDASVLDDCNGRTVNGNYQYHVRDTSQVNESLDYCKNTGSPENNWNYILGCYSGSISSTDVVHADSFILPDDCVLEGTSAPVASPTTTTSAPVASPTTTTSAPVASPVSAPTTAAPVSSPVTSPSSPSCIDSPLKFKLNGKNRRCKWVANKNTTKRCKKNGVKSHCPIICDGNCGDSFKKFYVAELDKFKKCKWVKNKNTENRCKKTGVSDTCRDACKDFV